MKFHKPLSVTHSLTDNQTHRSDQVYLGPIKIVNIKNERNVDDLLLVKLSSPSELLKIRSYDN